MANAVLPAYVTTLLFFAGFVFDFDTMPQWWKWYSYTDFMRFAWGALMVNQFKDNDVVWQGGKTVLENYRLKARLGAAAAEGEGVGPVSGLLVA